MADDAIDAPAPARPGPSRGVRLAAAVVLAGLLAGLSWMLHRNDPVEVEATLVVERTAAAPATAVSRTVAAATAAGLDADLGQGVERVAVTRLPNEPTIVAVVAASDLDTAEQRLDELVNEVLAVGRIEWEADIRARERDLEATLTALREAPEPAPRQQANVEGDLAQIRDDLEAGGNIVTVVDSGTTRSSRDPVTDAAAVGLVVLLAALAAEFVLGGPDRLTRPPEA